jgi:hypothetical protein
MTKLVDDLEALQKSLDAAIVQGPAYDVTDLYPTYKHLFNENAQEALSKKEATQQIYQRKVQLDPDNYVMVVDVCRYFTVQFEGKYNTRKAVEKLVAIINKHADHIVRPLTRLGLIKLSQIDLSSSDRYVVFSFLVFNPEGQKALDEAKYDVESQEGTITDLTVFDDSDPIASRLREGEFLALIGTSVFSHSSVDPKELVNDEIQKYLSLLPRGTKVVETKQLPISCLSINYEVRFINPLMNNYKEVRLLAHRECVMVGDKLEQFNLLDSIEYIKKN